MLTASREERFEAAAHYRDLVNSLETTSDKQRIASVGLEEEDYLAFHREGDIASVQLYKMREGQLQARREFSCEGIREEDAEFLSTCLTRYYESVDVIPATICVPVAPTSQDVLEEWLSDRKGARVGIAVPKRGSRRRLLETAAQNARMSFQAMMRSPHTHSVDNL